MEADDLNLVCVLIDDEMIDDEVVEVDDEIYMKQVVLME